MSLVAYTENGYFYICQFALGNFSYLFRCRFEDQTCCSHSCCYKAVLDREDTVFNSWYFWSLLGLVLLTLSCIIVSFLISCCKKKPLVFGQVDRSWANVLLAPGDLTHLASTSMGNHGIIEPNIYYKDNCLPSVVVNPPTPSHTSCFRKYIGKFRYSASHVQTLATLKAQGRNPTGPDGYAEELTKAKMTKTLSEHAPPMDEAAKRIEWLDLQLTPLSAPYRSSWSNRLHGFPFPQELRASQVLMQTTLPPGFINS